MTKGPKVDKNALLNAGLQSMAANGMELTKIPSRGTAKLFSMPNGETVRARTCNDHILIAVADEPKEGARLNIEGTDWIMLAMPEVPRTPGKVLVYLLPTDEVVEEVRTAHRNWLASRPDTRGNNRAWNLWFDESGPKKACGYKKKWSKYLLSGEETTRERHLSSVEDQDTSPLLKEIQIARVRIAKLAGVGDEAVHISVNFSG